LIQTFRYMYGTGQWDSQGLGDHRAVIYVDRAADIVSVRVPWRRLDSIGGKALILIAAFTDGRINNVYIPEFGAQFDWNLQ